MKLSKLSTREIEGVLDSYCGWTRQEGVLIKRFSFTDFEETIRFVNRVAALAQAADHHPDMRITYRHCTLTYVTHEIGGISAKDLHAIKEIEGWKQG
jgi:4a-hydroxytetrahydrobiopterin dehydratase